MFLMVFFFVLLIDKGVTPLELLELRVPAHVPLGTSAALSCRWQLGPTDVLYSVKWYKDGKEFFRHVPRDLEPRREFPLPGVDVQEFNASGSRILLAPARLETSGRYRCEVSGEGPLFPTVSEHADMVVVVLAEHKPSIIGLRSKYRPGDRLVVNCTSGQSHPPTELAWYLNGEPIPDLRTTQRAANGLVSTTLVLDFVVQTKHFKNEVIKVKCLATIPPIYWRSGEESAGLDRSRAHEHFDKRNTRTMNADPGQNNSACLVITRALLIYISICLLVW